jgi:hypothetical protein
MKIIIMKAIMAYKKYYLYFPHLLSDYGENQYKGSAHIADEHLFDHKAH